MASSFNSSSSSSSSSSNSNSSSTSFDNLLLQSLMGRLQLRPPYLDTNSFLSHSIDDLLLSHSYSPDSDEEEEEEGLEDLPNLPSRSLLSREEAKLEKEIIRIVHSGAAAETLKPNSGQSVAVGDHHICVGFHDDPRSEYRVWEWHGHVIIFDDDNGYSPEYVYGNYFERVSPRPNPHQEEEDVESRHSGLKDLIGDSSNKEKTAGAGRARVLHRNSFSASVQEQIGKMQI